MCCYNTPMNTIGIGNAIPAGINTLGSGDLFQFSKKNPYMKKGINKIKKKFNKTNSYLLNPPLLVMTKNKKR